MKKDDKNTDVQNVSYERHKIEKISGLEENSNSKYDRGSLNKIDNYAPPIKVESTIIYVRGN